MSEHSEDESSGSESIEWNVNQRSRRSTAGNRLSTLLGQEGSADDDEVQLLFQEDEDEPDEEFEEKDSDDDNAAEGDSSSSSEDEDEGNDELEGERQLQREERAKKKQQKRKTDQAFMRPRASRPKRVKITEPDDAATPDSAESPAVPAADEQLSEQQLRNKKKKKSERVSWLLNTGDHGPVRTSSRTLSMQNKERTQASLKESEAKRKRQIAVMEAAQKRRDAEKGRPMTQEERLAEAAQTEKLNSKSLNRWEEMERDRLERQRAKLEALQNRKLQGPFIRWVSSRAEWQGDTLVNVGRDLKIEEIEEPEPEPEPVEEAPAEGAQSGVRDLPGNAKNADTGENEATDLSMAEALHKAGHADGDQMAAETQLAGSAAIATEASENQAPAPMDTNTQGTPADSVGSLRNTGTDGRPGSADSADNFVDALTETNVEAKTEQDDQDQEEMEFLPGMSEYAAMHDDGPDRSATDLSSKPPGPEVQFQEGGGTAAPTQQPLNQATENAPEITEAKPPNKSTEQPVASIPVESTFSSQQRITLVNFSDYASTSLDAYRRVLFNWRPSQLSRPVKHAPQLCEVTSLPAKYRDPVTGIAYRDMNALRRVRRILEPDAAQRPIWSQALGAWIGIKDAATGVPPEFLSLKSKEIKVEPGIADPVAGQKGKEPATTDAAALA